MAMGIQKYAVTVVLTNLVQGCYRSIDLSLQTKYVYILGSLL